VNIVIVNSIELWPIPLNCGPNQRASPVRSDLGQASLIRNRFEIISTAFNVFIELLLVSCRSSWLILSLGGKLIQRGFEFGNLRVDVRLDLRRYRYLAG
jgi:hypothetical protein